MALNSRELARSMAKLQADQILTVIAGCICLSTGFHCFRVPYSRHYVSLSVAKDDHNMLDICTVLMSIVGAINIFIGAARINGFCRFNLNKYIITLVTTLLCNFVVGIILTDHRGKIPDALETAMRPHLQESIMSQLSLGVGFSKSESWDFLQTQMHCCGVESYQDYLIKKLANQNQPIPMSCCVMKRKLANDPPTPENVPQCMLDATHKATESVFLHVQGCRGPLSRWLVRHTSKMTAMIFASICFQALTLLYLSWKGYNASLFGRS